MNRDILLLQAETHIMRNADKTNIIVEKQFCTYKKNEATDEWEKVAVHKEEVEAIKSMCNRIKMSCKKMDRYRIIPEWKVTETNFVRKNNTRKVN